VVVESLSQATAGAKWLEAHAHEACGQTGAERPVPFNVKLLYWFNQPTHGTFKSCLDEFADGDTIAL